MANGAPTPDRSGKISSAGAVDLSRARPLTEEQQKMGRFLAEMQAGKRCGGCGKRIVEGFRFTRFVPAVEGGIVGGFADTKTACNRKGCNYAQALRDASDCVELMSVRWLDADGPDVEPPAELAERVQRRRAQKNGSTPAG